MNNTEKYLYWEDIAEYDLKTAEAMLESGRYLYVVFMCQQAVEKLVKGLYVLYKDEEPPRTHNIWNIFDMIFDIDELMKLQPLELEEYFSFFDELLAYYISGRYSSYKNKLSKLVNEDKAIEILDKTKEVFIWLKSLRILKE